MRGNKTIIRKRDCWGAALMIVCSLIAISTSVQAATASFDIAPQDLAGALKAFALQSHREIFFAPELARGRKSTGIKGQFDELKALDVLLEGTGLQFSITPSNAIVIRDSAIGHQITTAPSASGEFGGSDLDQSDVLNAIAALSASPQAGGISLERSDQDEIEQITVTAQRREEKLDKVPISVSAFSQRMMDDLHIESFSDLASMVPGLIFSIPSAGFQDVNDVAIRGIFSGGNAPTTQFYIDETPVAIRVLANAPSASPHPEIFDLDRVEVLRGPQGTLFGSSAMGGAIRYITPQPNLTESSGYSKADVSYLNRGAPSYEVGAAYGAPIVNGLAGFRVSAWYQAEGGFIDKEDAAGGEILKRNANSSDTYVIHATVSWAPLTGLTVTPGFFMQHVRSESSSSYWLNSLINPEVGAHVSGYASDPYSDDFRVSSLALNYEVAGLVLQSDSSYLDRGALAIDDYTRGTEYIFSGSPFVAGVPQSFKNLLYDGTYTHALQQEFRLSSANPASRLTWVAGLYYRHAVQGIDQCSPGSLDPLTEAIAGESSLQFTGLPSYTLSNGQLCNGYLNYRTTDVSEAAFGDITFEVFTGLKADVGVRVEHTVVEHQDQFTAGAFNGVSISYLVLPDQVGNPITPRYSLTYQINDNDMVYASAAKGYRAGGGNSVSSINGYPQCAPSLAALGLTSAPTSFASDSLWSYEIGTKDSFFERKLAIQASAFLIHWSDIQTNVSLPSCGFAFTANRGKAVSQGFDLQAAAILTDGLKLAVNVGYTDAYYPNAAYGAPVGGEPALLNAAGDKLVNVLPWTASANAEYSIDLNPLWVGARSYVRIDYRWLGAANALDPKTSNYDNDTGPNQNPAYGLLNLRLGVVRGGLDVSAYINNVTHSDPVLGYHHDAAGDPLYYGNAIRPMTAGISAYYRF